MDRQLVASYFTVKSTDIFYSVAGFGNFRPEVNWQCIDFDPLYTVSCGTCFSGLPPKISMTLTPLEP